MTPGFGDLGAGVRCTGDHTHVRTELMPLQERLEISAGLGPAVAEHVRGKSIQLRNIILLEHVPDDVHVQLPRRRELDQFESGTGDQSTQPLGREEIDVVGRRDALGALP